MRKRTLFLSIVVAALVAAPFHPLFAVDKPAPPRVELPAKLSPVDQPGSTPDLGFSCPNGGLTLLNQPPNQSNGIFSDGDCGSCGQGMQVVAADFVLAADTTVSQLVIWGGYFPGNMIPNPADPFTVIFHQDTGGLPGAAVSTEAGIAPSSVTQTGVVLFGVNEVEYVLDLTPVALTAGTYWVEIFVNSVGNADSFFWEIGDLDAANGRDGTAFAFEVPGTTWMNTAAQDFAIAICGAGGPLLRITDTTTADMCSNDPANENGVFEPGETITVDVEVSATNGGFTGISGTLSTATPGVTIVNGFSSYPDLGDGESATADTPFTVYLDESIACFSQVDLDVTINSNESAPLVTSISEMVGATLTPNVPLSIPDNDPGGASSDLVVADDVTLADVDVRVQIDHTWVGDIFISLRSPANTEVVLLDRPGEPPGAGCADDNMDVTFDDASGFDPEPHCPGSDPWYVGDAAPVGNLSDFNGESTAGTWTLIVSDNAGQDTGTIIDWQLITDPVIGGVCNICTAGPPGGDEEPIVDVPTMDTVGFIALLLALALAGVYLMRRRANA